MTAELSGRTRTHVITGQRDEVYAALSRAVEEGRLLSVTGARALAGERVQLTARLRDPAPASRWQRVWPWLVIAVKTVGVLAVLAVIGGVVWLVVTAVLALIALVTAVVTWIQTHLLLIGLVIAAFLALVVYGGGGGCGGIHCGGCRG